MSVEPGHFALTLAFMLALFVAVGVPCGLSGRVVRVAMVVQAVLLTVSFGFLVMSFALSDFSVALVATHSHSAKPFLYKIAAAWGNHEGSFLLWILAMSLCGVLATLHLPRIVLCVQNAINTLFMFFLLFASNPFERTPGILFEGEGFNPVLQHPALALHPPVLYGGYAALAVVFSIGIGVLISGNETKIWTSWLRPWALFACASITAGIALGSWWAYQELGWGGFWFWDPVENASLLPWIATTALLHTAAVTTRRGALAGWTVFLCLCGFIFALLGTFLVRSGTLVSVHAFAQDPLRGIFILGMIGVIVFCATVLFCVRAPVLSRSFAFPPLSREGFLILNNLFLTAAAVSVLAGTLYPVVIDVLGGGQLSVGAPYFAATFMPMFALLVFLIPFGPLLPWGRNDLQGATRRLVVPAGVCVFVGIILFASVPQMTAVGGLILGVWCLSGAVRDFFVRAPSLNRRINGRSLAHAGVGVLMLGITGTTLLQKEYNGVLHVGERVSVWDGRYQVTLHTVEDVHGPNYRAHKAQLSVRGAGRHLAHLFPETRFYPASRAATTEADIRALPLAHLYAVLGPMRDDGRWTIRLYYNPLTTFLWIGAALMTVGALLTVLRRPVVLGILFIALSVSASSAQLLPQDVPLKNPVLEAQAQKIFDQLRCVVCSSQSLGESSAPMAQDLRDLVRQKLLKNEKPETIIAYITTLYGDAVLLRPPFELRTFFLWGAPFMTLAVGGFFVTRFLNFKGFGTGTQRKDCWRRDKM